MALMAGYEHTARDEYLGALEDALASQVARPERRKLLGQTREALDEAFGDLGRPETVAEIAEVFGVPEDLARALAREAGTRRSAGAGGETSPAEDAAAGGDVLGMPYDVRVPTAERFASRMWNPADPRLFVPRAFGLGWDLNFGAVAVRLRLMRPDDVQDVPFSGVPKALTASLAWASLAAIAAALVWMLTAAGSLPARIPYHFGIGGPDRFAAPTEAAFQLLGIPLAFAAVIVFSTFVRRGSSLGRGLAAAATPAIALLGLGMWGNALSWAMRGRYLLPTAMAVIVPLLVLFALLLLLTRVGLRAEWREHGVGRK